MPVFNWKNVKMIKHTTLYERSGTSLHLVRLCAASVVEEVCLFLRLTRVGEEKKEEEEEEMGSFEGLKTCCT